MAPVTLVSAYIELKENRGTDRSFETCCAFFQRLAATALPIVVFLSHTFAARAASFPPNVHVRFLELTDTRTHAAVQAVPGLTVPATNAPYHDTAAFMTLINAKMEMVQRVAEENPFGSTHFGWIDFSICHVLSTPDTTLARLTTYCTSVLRSPMFAIPGCWPAGVGSLADAVVWRFCGGFFLGDRASVLNACALHAHVFPTWLSATRRVVWEVNIWAWMETQGWKPDWYAADHNDSILALPSQWLSVVASLTTIPPRAESVRQTLDSLLPQVDAIYVCVAPDYVRFGQFTPPAYWSEPPYKDKVKVVLTEDTGPATKYLGALPCLPSGQWMFVCDDDQAYHGTLMQRMADAIKGVGVYQNRYEIVRWGSGGIVHGYVGVWVRRDCLDSLPGFPRPRASRYVDDQWMSAYCAFHDVPVIPTGIESYGDIFSVLRGGVYEQVGAAPLAALGNRDLSIRELEKELGITFLPGGRIKLLTKD